MILAHSPRGTLFVEKARILARDKFEAGQIILRAGAPRIARAARPGTFVHARCDPALPMRRPLSIMTADPASGELTILFKVVGKGTRLLAGTDVGEELDLIGPIGVPFRPVEDRPRALLVGGGVGIPPMIFLAMALDNRCRSLDKAHGPGDAADPGDSGHRGPARKDPADREMPPATPASYGPFLLMGSEVPFPFEPCPSRIPVPHLPDGVTAAMPMMEALGIPSRLASGRGYPGGFRGSVTALAEAWLMGQPPHVQEQTALYACGPEPMLRATADLARRYALPCQVCLEEFMACGVGACAGCAVPVTTPAGTAMRRVCVDGPVFDAREVFGVKGLTGAWITGSVYKGG